MVGSSPTRCNSAIEKYPYIWKMPWIYYSILLSQKIGGNCVCGRYLFYQYKIVVGTNEVCSRKQQLFAEYSNDVKKESDPLLPSIQESGISPDPVLLNDLCSSDSICLTLQEGLSHSLETLSSIKVEYACVLQILSVCSVYSQLSSPSSNRLLAKSYEKELEAALFKERQLISEKFEEGGKKAPAGRS